MVLFSTLPLSFNDRLAEEFHLIAGVHVTVTKRTWCFTSCTMALKASKFKAVHCKTKALLRKVFFSLCYN